MRAMDEILLDKHVESRTADKKLCFFFRTPIHRSSGYASPILTPHRPGLSSGRIICVACDLERNTSMAPPKRTITKWVRSSCNSSVLINTTYRARTRTDDCTTREMRRNAPRQTGPILDGTAPTI